jgi:integrase
MKSNETKRKHDGQFIAARDSRNRKVPGLSTRNGRFYGTLWTESKSSAKKTARRFPLLDSDGEPCRDLSSAKTAFDLLKGRRIENALPLGGRKPGFSTWVEGEDGYLKRKTTLEKKSGTIENETQSLSRWKDHLGSTRLDKISTAMVDAFIQRRLAGGRIGTREFAPVAPRTIKLDCITLRNALKAAVDAGHLLELPKFPRIEVPPAPRRNLVTPAQFKILLASCTAKNSDGSPVTRNGEQLRDFLRFLAYSGSREQEALKIVWDHVDFKGRRVFIGAPEEFDAARPAVGSGGESKNRGSRVVDFNPNLEKLLKEMRSRRAPDCKYLFPSPQRGSKDIPARSLRESLRMVRGHAGIHINGFHDLRHLFASHCIMGGVDFMTTANWLGHKDGGILVGKVYGHLLTEHRQKMAAKLKFGSA